MNKVIDLIKNTPTYIDSRSEKMFDWTLDATIELRRLTAIEQAASALIKCKGRYHAERNTKALAASLGIELPQQSVSAEQKEDKPIFWYRPCCDGEMYEGPVHDKVIEQVRKDSGVWIPLHEHPPEKKTVDLGTLAFAFSFVCKNYIPKDFPQPLEQSVLAAVLLEALWPHLSDDGRKSHRAVVDAMVAGKLVDCLS